MTWAEFQLRLFAYMRKEELSWQKIFEINKSIISSSIGDKTQKKKAIKDMYKNYFGEQMNELSDFQIETIKRLQKEAVNRK